MKKQTTKLLSLMLISVMLLSLVIGVAAAQSTSSPSGEQKGIFVALWDAFFGGLGGSGESEDFGEFMSDKFGLTGVSGSTTTGEFIGFFLIMFLVFMLVYDITDLLPFFRNGWMRFGISIAFTFLAFLFFDIQEIRALTMTYQAVGITLVAVLPFLVIMAFTWKLNQKAQEETKPTYKYMSSLVWVFFGIYLLFKWNQLQAIDSSNPILMAYLIVGIVSLVLAGIHYRVFTWFSKKKDAETDKMGRTKELKNQIQELEIQIKQNSQAMTLAKNKGSEEGSKEEQRLLNENERIAKQIDIIRNRM